MIPKIIHKSSVTWSWEEKKLLTRNLSLMKDFQFILWNDEQNRELFNKYFPDLLEEYDGFKQGVIRVDIARCLYLYEYGGIYCDTDYKFYKPVDAKFLAHKCVLGYEDENASSMNGNYKIGNAFMASEPKFDMWLDFVESIFERHKKGVTDVVFLSGPHALSQFLHNHKTYEDIITFMDINDIFPPFQKRKMTTYRDKNTLGAHLCWGSWRNKPFIQKIKSRGRRIISSMI